MTYTFTPSQTANPEQVKQLELDLATLKPTSKHKRRISRPLWDYGLTNLAPSKDPPYRGPSPHVVRIYYKSMGGEILCCDTEVMSYHKAQSVAAEHNKDRWYNPPSDAVGALVLPIKNGVPYKVISKGCREPRHVTFPSQMQIPVEISSDVAKAA